MNNLYTFLVCFLLLPLITCFSQKNILYQYATFNSLAGGMYDGDLNTSMLVKKANLGLGTFNCLDGELILLDSICYRAKADTGIQIEHANNSETPFVVAINFEPQDSMSFQYASKIMVDSVMMLKIPASAIVAFKIHGLFSYIRFRSVAAQKKPYPALTIAVKDQKIFEKANIEGTLVGFYFPAYMSGVNVEGFHWHFISLDKTSGGHVLDYQADKVCADWAIVSGFHLDFPKAGDFFNSNYKANKTEIQFIEKGK